MVRLIECVNNLVQAAKQTARGYRSPRNLVAIIYPIRYLKLATEIAKNQSLGPIPR